MTCGECMDSCQAGGDKCVAMVKGSPCFLFLTDLTKGNKVGGTSGQPADRVAKAARAADAAVRRAVDA